MIRTELELIPRAFIGSITTREVDPHSDPEIVLFTALNLEMAVRNLMTASNPPECCVLTADICTHRLMAMPTEDGNVKVLVTEC